MSEYTLRFAENRIDFSVLRDLTDQDLKDLGVVPGDRRKMLHAIATLEDTPAAAASAAPAATPVVREQALPRQRFLRSLAVRHDEPSCVIYAEDSGVPRANRQG